MAKWELKGWCTVTLKMLRALERKLFKMDSTLNQVIIAKKIENVSNI